jgi:DNA-directed RNA polymerase specialized sigma24 family protein
MIAVGSDGEVAQGDDARRLARDGSDRSIMAVTVRSPVAPGREISRTFEYQRCMPSQQPGTNRVPEAGPTPSRLEALHRMALRYAVTPDEADDLFQDVLLVAVEQRRRWDETGCLAWAGGVFRRRASFIARTEGRRRRREAAYEADRVPASDRERRMPPHFIESLPPSLRTVALLANLGLGRPEIASVLGIPDTALRQRISGLRRAWRDSDVDPERREIPLGSPHPLAIHRRALRNGLARLPGGRLAFADPDGHPIFVGDAHTPAGRGNP